ncbi:MAG: hypothetical protein EA374_00315 [Acholeplasmatales bacterium]|nr:MAG: hypothetical protein EA374_00315 [Acholeplasmatales bacterium]
MKKLLITLIVLITTGMFVYVGLLIFGVLALNSTPNYGYGHHGYGFHGIGMGLFWIIVIVGLLYFLDHPHHDRKTDRAIDTLNERLARGEIDKDTYKLIKNTLEGH